MSQIQNIKKDLVSWFWDIKTPSKSIWFYLGLLYISLSLVYTLVYKPLLFGVLFTHFQLINKTVYRDQAEQI